MSKAQEYFELYPSVNTFHETSDGQFFEEKNEGQAKSHAKTLIDDTIQIHNREVEKDEIDLEVPTSKNTVDQIKAYLDTQEIDYTGISKKEDLLALLVAE